MGNWDKVWAWQPKLALYHKKKRLTQTCIELM